MISDANHIKFVGYDSPARIVGSAVEHHIDIVGVTGSIPVRSTKYYALNSLKIGARAASSWHRFNS